MFIPDFVVHIFVSFLVFNHLDLEERAGCLTLSASWCSVIDMWLFPTVPWVGLQCMIVVFPDPTILVV